jgi:hypothetical protein
MIIRYYFQITNFSLPTYRRLVYLFTNANFYWNRKNKLPNNFYQPIPNTHRLFYHSELNRLTCSNIIL